MEPAGGETPDAPPSRLHASVPVSPAVVLLVVALFAVITLMLGWAFDRGSGQPNDLDCSTGPDVYTPPCPQQFSLVWVLAGVTSASVVLTVVAWRWRRVLLGAFPDTPGGVGRWLLGTRQPVNVVGLLVFTVVVALQLRYGPNFDFARSYGEGFDFGALERTLVRAPIWVAAAPVFLAAVTIFDVSEIARGNRDRFVPPNEAKVERLVTLRRTLDSNLWLLGFELGLWVVSHAAVAEYVIAVATAADGNQGGATPELTAGTTILVMGAVVTAILALLYMPTALAVDAVATDMLDAADPNETIAYDDLRQRIGTEQSVQERLYKGLSIAAPPLAGAVVTTFVL